MSTSAPTPDPSPEIIAIASGPVTADVAPGAGGRLAQLTIDGVPLLVGHTPDADATGWGAYPMVPWAGRIRRGRFSFDGREYQLPINFGHHSIHGIGFASEWRVDAHDARHLSLRLDMPADDIWPFGGVATHELHVDDGGITMTLTATAIDHAFPVSFGWHPWFRKPAELDFRPTAMYRRDDDYIAVDELVPVAPGPWDDCFTNTEPVRVSIDGVDLRLTSDCNNWVVYDEPEHATCVEPQTAPPDAFNIAVQRVEPGDSVSAWYRINRA